MQQFDNFDELDDIIADDAREIQESDFYDEEYGYEPENYDDYFGEGIDLEY